MKTPLIYTCALRPFYTSDAFFTRDSGLLCRSLQSIGIPAKAIVPEQNPPAPKREDVIRADYEKEMKNPEWWKNFNIDAVIFVTWGEKKDTEIINAAKKAGLIIILVADDGNGKLYSIKEIYTLTLRRHYHLSFFKKHFITLIKTPLTIGYYIKLLGLTGNSRYIQYSLADYLQVINPFILDNIKQGVKKLKINWNCEFGIGCSANRINPKPLAKDIHNPIVVCVGLWEKVKHKRPHYLLDVAHELLNQNKKVHIHVYGKMPEFMHQRWEQEPNKERLHLHGIVPQDEILTTMSKAQVFFCPSATDAVPVPVVEALCSGCSVCGGGGMVRWASAEGYGVCSTGKDNPIEEAQQINEELGKWENNHYQASQIAQYWIPHVSSLEIVKNMVTFVTSKTTK
ncbi:MAG: glycosyltransferase [Akkermansia sp.]|nr:glycosyltransferase [Akkermansia sp.]